MDQEEWDKNFQFKFGYQKYINMAMMMCLFQNDDFNNYYYSLRPSDNDFYNEFKINENDQIVELNEFQKMNRLIYQDFKISEKPDNLVLQHATQSQLDWNKSNNYNNLFVPSSIKRQHSNYDDNFPSKVNKDAEKSASNLSQGSTLWADLADDINLMRKKYIRDFSGSQYIEYDDNDKLSYPNRKISLHTSSPHNKCVPSKLQNTITKNQISNNEKLNNLPKLQLKKEENKNTLNIENCQNKDKKQFTNQVKEKIENVIHNEKSTIENNQNEIIKNKVNEDKVNQIKVNQNKVNQNKVNQNKVNQNKILMNPKPVNVQSKIIPNLDINRSTLSKKINIKAIANLKNCDLSTEEIYCVNVVNNIKKHPNLMKKLRKSIPNFDQILIFLTKPLKSTVFNTQNEDNFSNMLNVNLSRHDLGSIIKIVIDNNFTNLSSDVEKIVASFPSSEFHSYFKIDEQDNYKRIKELRRKLRNKYAARICRKKRLDEGDQLKNRTIFLNTILKSLQNQVNIVKTKNQKLKTLPQNIKKKNPTFTALPPLSSLMTQNYSKTFLNNSQLNSNYSPINFVQKPLNNTNMHFVQSVINKNTHNTYIYPVKSTQFLPQTVSSNIPLNIPLNILPSNMSINLSFANQTTILK